MKLKAVMLSLLIILSMIVVLEDMNSKVDAQTTLTDDKPKTFSDPSAEQFEFTVNSVDHAVIGIRPPMGTNYDIEVYTDTTYGTLIEGSYGSEGEIDFVALDKSVWASPPDRGAIVTSVSGTGDYQIEMENTLPSYSFGDSWTMSFGASFGGPVIEIGPPGSWEDQKVGGTTVFYDGSVYHMWYHGTDIPTFGGFQIGYANSTDGINWTKYSSNPVMTKGPAAWESAAIGVPIVIFDGAIYHMWYMGNDGSTTKIGYANSTNGLSWNKYASNPVLPLGAPNSWEDNLISHPEVIFNGTGYQMWYHGHDDNNYRIGYATSPDGLSWNKPNLGLFNYGGNTNNNIVLDLGPSGSWDDWGVGTPSVFYDGGTYHMWYNGQDGSNTRIGYATSPDGINWTRYVENPLLDIGEPGSWDDKGIWAPTVIFNGTEYLMWYTGSDGSNTRIGYANSTDGINWTKIALEVEVLDAYELSGASIGTMYNITLNVPITLDLDMFLFDFQGDDSQSRIEASWSSENEGLGIDESLKITTNITGDYLLVITNCNCGTGSYTIDALPIPKLYDDTPVTDGGQLPNDWQFEVLSEDHAVVGVRYAISGDFDIEVNTDTFSTLIETSSFVGDAVDFVVLNKTVWESPPNRGARVSSGTSSYVIEMENDVDDHLITETWSGTMDASFGGPVIDLGPPGSWDDSNILSPFVMFDGMTYHMWYGGYDGTNRRIGYANSSDGITWTKPNLGLISYGGNSNNNIVLDLGSTGSWDDYHVNSPTVIFDGITYHMWYTAYDGGVDHSIGYANSTDGINWIKYAGNPVLVAETPPAWDDYCVLLSEVIYDGAIYHVWFTGWNGTNTRIGYANSTNGIDWTKHPGNPVLDIVPSSWEDIRAEAPAVIYEGGEYHMWYTGYDGAYYRIGYANSTDGISWLRSGANPILDIGTSGDWDDSHVKFPTVIYDGEKYQMWYQGHDSSNKRIGYATSPDGTNWTKFYFNAEVLDAYEVTGLTAGSFYTVDLEVPSTADLDMFLLNTTGGRNDAVTASTNVGAGINESKGFIAPVSGDYLLIITNEDGGIGPYIINPPIDLTVTGNPIASGNVIVGETEVVVEKLTLSVEAHSAVVTAIKIDQIGTADDSDIGNVYLYYDVNRNGILEIGVDKLLDVQVFIGNTLTFTNLSIMLNASSDEYLLLTLDIPLDAEVGNTIQLDLADNTYFTANEPDNVSALNFPIQSNILTIVKPTLMVTGFPKATGNVLVGQEDVVMEQLALTSEFDSVNVTNITVYLIGSGEDTDLTNAYLYDDLDDDGELDPTDILFDTQSFTNGNLTFGPLSYPVMLGFPENLLIVLDISNGSTIGHVLGLVINTSSEVSVLSPAVVSPNNFPVISGFIEITGGEITGSVEDLIDNPIENAVVQLLNQTGDVVNTFTTNTTGSFSFGDLFYNNYTLNVTAVGYQYNNSVTVNISLGTPIVDVGIIKLVKIPSPPVTTGNITGKVVDETDVPIEGAIVQLKNSTGSILVTYTTNFSGDFEFIDVLFGTYNLTAFAEGYEENDTAFATTSSGVPDVDVGSIRLSLIPEPPITTGNITGEVVDEGIIPIEGAIVQIKNSTGALITTYTTNLTGDFKFMNMPFDTYNLTAFADGYETNDTVTGAISMGIPNVDIGNIILTEIPAPPITTGNITGKIVDGDGISIGGAIAQLINDSGSVVTTYTTNTTGDFEFTNIPFDTYDIMAFAEGYQTNDSVGTSITSGNPDEDVGDIVLTAIPDPPITKGNITGKVVDENGEPIEGAIIQIMNSTGVIIATHTTNSLGDFEFIDILFDTYNIRAFAEGYQVNDTTSATITSGNPDANTGDIVLIAIPEPLITTGNITGKVVDTDEDPIDDAIVQLINDSGNIISTYTTDSTGEFEFTDVPFATYNLLAFAQGYDVNGTVFGTISSSSTDLDVGDIQLSADIGPPVPTTGTIKGNVYDPEGGPIQVATIILLDEAGNPTGTQKTTDVNGYYNFIDVGFGNYSIEVSHEDYITANSDIFILDTDNPDIYIITTLSPIPEEIPPPEEKETTPLWIWLLIFLLIVICVILFFLWLYSRKREPEKQVRKPEMSPPKEPIETPQKPSPEEPVREQPEKQIPTEPPETKSEEPQEIPPPPSSEPQPSESQETPSPPSTEEQPIYPEEILPPPPDD